MREVIQSLNSEMGLAIIPNWDFYKLLSTSIISELIKITKQHKRFE
jgi:hypothetical protein